MISTLSLAIHDRVESAFPGARYMGERSNSGSGRFELVAFAANETIVVSLSERDLALARYDAELAIDRAIDELVERCRRKWLFYGAQMAVGMGMVSP